MNPTVWREKFGEFTWNCPKNNNGRTSSANFDRNRLKHNVLMNSCYSKGKTCWSSPMVIIIVIGVKYHHHRHLGWSVFVTFKCIRQSVKELSWSENKSRSSAMEIWSSDHLWLELFSFVTGIVQRLQSQRLPHKCRQEPSKNVTLLPQHLPPSHFSLVSATCYKSCPRLPILANISLFLKKVTDTLLMCTTSD